MTQPTETYNYEEHTVRQKEWSKPLTMVAYGTSVEGARCPLYRWLKDLMEQEGHNNNA